MLISGDCLILTDFIWSTDCVRKAVAVFLPIDPIDGIDEDIDSVSSFVNSCLSKGHNCPTIRST